MRHLFRVSFALAAIGATALALVASAQAGTTLVNPGFETGNTAGWSGNGFVTGSYAGYNAPDGNHFAVIPAGCSTNTLSQSFSASANDTLEGWSFFKANDYLPYNDSGSVQLSISGGGTAAVLFSSSVAAVGSYGGTPWQHWIYTFPSTGTYTIQAISSNAYDCVASSVVGLDLRSDTTPPTISASAMSGGSAYSAGTWTNQDVVVHFDCTDAGSGVASVTSDQTVSTEGAGQSVSGSCTDVAGNTSTATFSGVEIDKTAPTIGYTGNAGTYTVDQQVAIACMAQDGLSGLASSTCSDVTGQAYTFGLGPHTYTATATDAAGNSANASTTFTVVATYDSLCGLVRQFSTSSGVADGLCAKLAAASAAANRGQTKAAHNILDAFAHQVSAQSGKALTATQAGILTDLSASL